MFLKTFLKHLGASKAQPTVYDKSIKEWRKLLKHPDRHVREIAAIALARIGPTANAAVPRLSFMLVGTAEALNEDNPTTKTGLELLSRAATWDKSAEVRAAAAYALGEIGSKRKVLPVLKTSLLTDFNETVQTSVFLTIKCIQGEVTPDKNRILSWEDFLSRKRKEGWKGW